MSFAGRAKAETIVAGISYWHQSKLFVFIKLMSVQFLFTMDIFRWFPIHC